MGSEARFNLIIAGELVSGAAPEAVKNNLAKLLKLPPEKTQVLLATKPRILQKNIDQATAMKWRAALQRAGLKSTLQPMDLASPIQEPEPVTAHQSTHSQQSNDDHKNIEMVGTIRTGGNEFTGPFEVAEVGADIAESKEELPALIPATEHLSMAPVGAEIDTLKEEQEIAIPDVSHLSYS